MNNKLRITKNIMLSFLCLVKAIWSAAITIISGVASILLFVGLMAYFSLVVPQGLLDITKILIDNWNGFLICIFVLYFYSNLKEVFKDE